MSRSRRSLPITGTTTAPSDKRDKQKANRLVRRQVRAAIARDPDGVLPHRRELSDPWQFDKDGKLWHLDGDPRWLRK
jgi:hypothetical protein